LKPERGKDTGSAKVKRVAVGRERVFTSHRAKMLMKKTIVSSCEGILKKVPEAKQAEANEKTKIKRRTNEMWIY